MRNFLNHDYLIENASSSFIALSDAVVFDMWIILMGVGGVVLNYYSDMERL
jgi:hypothetical protein